MYKIGNISVKKVFIGNTLIKAIYSGDKAVFANIIEVITGSDYSDWVYTDPTRTRTITPYTQYKYADGSLSEKIYGEPSEETQQAVSTVEYGEWEYNITVSSGTRERTVTNKYTYNQDDPPTVRTSPASPEEETGTRSAGTTYTYDWENSQRTNVITYTFTDTTKTIDNVESGTVTYDFNIIVTPNDSSESITQIPASGGIYKAVTSGNISRLWNGSPVSGQETTASVESTTTTGSWITNGNLGLFTVVSRDTTVGDELQGSVKASTTVDNKEIESDVINLTFQANAVVSTQYGELTYSGVTNVNSKEQSYPYSVTASDTLTYTSGATSTVPASITITPSSGEAFITFTGSNMNVAENTTTSNRSSELTFSANTPNYQPITHTIQQNKRYEWTLVASDISATGLSLRFNQIDNGTDAWMADDVNVGTVTISSKNSVGGNNPTVTINANGVNNVAKSFAYNEPIPSLGSPIEMGFQFNNAPDAIIRNSTPEDINHLTYNLPSSLSINVE